MSLVQNIFKALPVIEADDLFRSLENFDGALDLAFGDLDVAPSEPPISYAAGSSKGHR